MNDIIYKQAWIFKSCFTSLPVLLNSGFYPSDFKEVEATKILPECFQLDMKNEENIKIEITFDPDIANYGSFTFFIFSSVSHTSISLNDWLKHKTGKPYIKEFRLISYSGDFEERLKGFCEFLTSVLENPELQKILRGDAWEEIPFSFRD